MDNQNQHHQLTTTSSSLSSSSVNLPLGQEWQLLKEQAAYLISSGLLPKSVQKPEQAVLVILKGRELGISPLLALTHINIIQGKPCMSAELMLSQIYRHAPKTVIKFKERSNERCHIEVKREGHAWESFQFSLDDAKKAGLTNNPSWAKYPRAMCHARCISEMARSLFPDAIAGVSYTPEELGAEVDADGAVIDSDLPPTKTAPEVPPDTHPVIEAQVKKQANLVDAKDPKWITYLQNLLKKREKNYDDEQFNRFLQWIHGKPWSGDLYNEAVELIEFEKDLNFTIT